MRQTEVWSGRRVEGEVGGGRGAEAINQQPPPPPCRCCWFLFSSSSGRSPFSSSSPLLLFHFCLSLSFSFPSSLSFIAFSFPSLLSFYSSYSSFLFLFFFLVSFLLQCFLVLLSLFFSLLLALFLLDRGFLQLSVAFCLRGLFTLLTFICDSLQLLCELTVFEEDCSLLALSFSFPPLLFVSSLAPSLVH